MARLMTSGTKLDACDTCVCTMERFTVVRRFSSQDRLLTARCFR